MLELRVRGSRNENCLTAWTVWCSDAVFTAWGCSVNWHFVSLVLVSIEVACFFGLGNLEAHPTTENWEVLILMTTSLFEDFMTGLSRSTLMSISFLSLKGRDAIWKQGYIAHLNPFR